MNDAIERATLWLEDPACDEATKVKVRELLKNPTQLTDAFFTDLSFGTGGLRGVMGVGTSRINIYTIRKATQGLANYIKKKGDPSKGVVIGFDSRHHSALFAEETAKVLCGNGIATYLLPELRPTPFVSFACRHLKAQAAVMITASHNPKEYNGYKVYWQDGGQIVPPHDLGIIAEMSAIQEVKLSSSFTKAPLTSLDNDYLSAIATLQLFPSQHKPLDIVYTSLHGTGITLMPRALACWGFSPPHLVASQIEPDGNFPTVPYPNPEHSAALQIGIEELMERGADLLLATDPDADRLGVVVNHLGQPTILNGHELAALGAYFICNTLMGQKRLPSNGALVTTTVTTELLKSIASAFNITHVEVPTGFKYIGEKIEKMSSHQFLFGAEESHGYLIGTHARDKDGIVAGCLFAEMAFQMKLRGQTVVDLLHEIYQKFGIFREKSFSLSFEEGQKGVEKIHHIMTTLRSNPPKTLGDQEVVSSDLLKPDVLKVRLQNQTEVIIRPSGTEPKLKFYLATHTTDFSSVQESLALCDQRLDELILALKKTFLIGSLS